MKNTVLDIAELSTLLKETSVSLEFAKVSDGSVRKMVCTQNFKLIPESDYPKTELFPTAENDEIFRVYDLEKNSWRSFRKDSVISF